MTRASRQKTGKGCFELLEEATQLVRGAPLSALACYAIGTLPLVLGFLYFWMDVSRSPFAGQHLAGAALAIAALFLWAKIWHVAFLRSLRSVLSGAPSEPLGARGWLGISITQAVLQPTGLFLLPLALLPALPWPRAFAFYQNASVLADHNPGRVRPLVKAAARQARLWPRQNWLVLALLTGFSLCVWVNWASICFVLPQLAKMLFGIESVFTRDPLALLNSTSFATTLGLTYLSVDPLVKAVYCLRCFYGESRQSGEDLKAELRAATLSEKTPALAVLLLLAATSGAAGAPPTINPQEPGAAPLSFGRGVGVRGICLGQLMQFGVMGTAAVNGIDPSELDKAIDEVLREDKYAWRAPRVQLEPANEHENVITRFLRQAGETIRHWLNDFFSWLGRVLRRLLWKPSPTTSGSGYGWMVSLQLLMYVLIIAVAAALALLLYRAWRRSHAPPTALASEPIQPTPDVGDTSVGAEQLPQDAWRKLGWELVEKGEYRLAVRAFYLASLAHLAEQNLIALARFKSNRDYERELKRRAHAFPELLTVFGENVSVFDCVWYGLHPAERDLATRFAANVDQIVTGGAETIAGAS